jgi:hypothetical protein
MTFVLVKLQGLVSSSTKSLTSVKLRGTKGFSDVYAGYMLLRVVEGSARHRERRDKDCLLSDSRAGQNLREGMVSN